MRIFPLSWFGAIAINENPLTDDQESKSLVSNLRKSHRQSVRQSIRKVQEQNKRESIRQMSIRKSRAVSGGLAMRASQRGKDHNSRAIN